ncbi:MAG: 50S ribosomal protein L24e [Desulfurococcales archaeon]|nr:50S ribosomal protein L24e [Desulfurococcales archaeon]
MPKLKTCSFCGGIIEPGTGIMYVTRRGDVLWFCSSKCHKSFLKLKRNPSKLAWVRKMKRPL